MKFMGDSTAEGAREIISARIRPCKIVSVKPSYKSFYQCDFKDEHFIIKQSIADSSGLERYEGVFAWQFSQEAKATIRSILHAEVSLPCATAADFAFTNANDVFYYSPTDNPQDCVAIENNGVSLQGYHFSIYEMCHETLIHYDYDC